MMGYVYTFASSLDGKVFYVGEGQGTRIKSHIWEAASKREKVSRVAQRIRLIWQQGGKVIIRKPHNNVGETSHLEKQLIEYYGYEQLVNQPWAKHRYLVPTVTIGRATFPANSKRLLALRNKSMR